MAEQMWNNRPITSAEMGAFAEMAYHVSGLPEATLEIDASAAAEWFGNHNEECLRICRDGIISYRVPVRK